MADDHVLVTTEFRGVFFGKLLEDKGRVVILGDAQNCVYWSSDVHGVFGLAAKGPTGGCRVGPKVPRLTLHKVTSITDCSEEAVKAWESEPWN